MSEQRTFPNDPTSVTAARRYALEVLVGISPAIADAVAVMVSELAANAVRHATSDFTVGVDRSPTAIRVEVSDSGPGRPTVRAPQPSEPSGRGLQIVEALAEHWGVLAASDSAGKTVWFTIALAPAPDSVSSVGVEQPAPEERRRAPSGDRPQPSVASDDGNGSPSACTRGAAQRGRFVSARHVLRSRSSAGRPTRVTVSTSPASARRAATVQRSRGRVANGSNSN